MHQWCIKWIHFAQSGKMLSLHAGHASSASLIFTASEKYHLSYASMMSEVNESSLSVVTSQKKSDHSIINDIQNDLYPAKIVQSKRSWPINMYTSILIIQIVFLIHQWQWHIFLTSLMDKFMESQPHGQDISYPVDWWDECWLYAIYFSKGITILDIANF